MEKIITTEAAMEALGACVATACADRGGLIYLQGELGAGKTTLVRGLLHGLGHQGPVKSPTFTLVEPYELGTRRVYHFDLYRVNDADELEAIGVRDYFTTDSLCLIEWPARGAGLLPQADLKIEIRYAEVGRHVKFQAATASGGQMLARLMGKNQETWG
ncbi:MAG: tRNA (adenosine(37)-N6)-threonylcarbamoyltransferase complex ATPase subunit type 1 TsaE [Gammaproteobacteria bacterium]